MNLSIPHGHGRMFNTNKRLNILVTFFMTSDCFGAMLLKLGLTLGTETGRQDVIFLEDYISKRIAPGKTFLIFKLARGLFGFLKRSYIYVKENRERIYKFSKINTLREGWGREVSSLILNKEN